MRVSQDRFAYDAYETARSIYYSTNYSAVRHIMKDVMSKLRERGVENCCR